MSRSPHVLCRVLWTNSNINLINSFVLFLRYFVFPYTYFLFYREDSFSKRLTIIMSKNHRHFVNFTLKNTTNRKWQRRHPVVLVCLVNNHLVLCWRQKMSQKSVFSFDIVISVLRFPWSLVDLLFYILNIRVS